MDFILGLDYELFFGNAPGTAQYCLIEPTEHLLAACADSGLKVTLFVDAGYLLALRRGTGSKPRGDLKTIAGQLAGLKRQGHEVQLHIHPHWEDSSVTEGVQLDVRRYRLHDFAPPERTQIAATYKSILEELADQEVTAYRAGGWCIQPFAAIRESLQTAGIQIDSTVYRGGHNRDGGRSFDFTHAPDRDFWRFSDNPAVPDDDGEFLEIPISSVAMAPTDYLKEQLARKLRPSIEHASFGDGLFLDHEPGYYWRLLSRRSTSPASVDGFKAQFLRRAYDQVQRRGGNLLNVMGHPKSLTRGSLRHLTQFLGEKTFNFHTVSSYAESVG
jgi:hypothetical protein